MSKRTPEQWQELFSAQQASGLSQAEFCKENKLCSKYFSLRRRQLMSSTSTKTSSALIAVQPPTPSVKHDVSVHYQGIEIRLVQAEANLIARIVKQLV